MRREISTRVRRLGTTKSAKGNPQYRIGGYGVVFGSPDQRDLYGDFFTARTDFMLDLYPNPPAFYDHSLGHLPAEMDKRLPRNFLLGRVVKSFVDTVGLWTEAVLFDHAEWKEMVEKEGIDFGAEPASADEHTEWINGVLSLIDKGVMHWSSGSVSHLVNYGPDFELMSWPVVEMSVTPTPAEPRKTDIVRLKHFVSNQDTPEATALKAARRGAPETVQPDHSDRVSPMKGSPTMTLIINDKAARAVVWAIAEDNQDQLKAAFDAYVKQDGNAIAELVRPMAEELAGVAGVDVEAAQQYLIEFVAQNAAGGGEEPEPEPAAEPAPMMSAGDVQKAVDKAVEARMQALLKQQPDGAFLTPKQKNVHVIRTGPKEITSLTRMIRAIRDGEHAMLRDHNKAAKDAYRAMGINPDTAGGYLVAPAQGTEIIGELEAKTVVMPLCDQIPMPDSDTLDIPTDEGGVTAYWTPENTQISASDNAFGQRKLVARTLTALVKVSNQLLESASPDVDAFLRGKIARKMALKIDESILQGSGVGEEPLGLANYPAALTKTALNAAPTFANIVDMISRVEVEDVDPDPLWTFVFHPREKATLSKVQDTTSGDFLWTELGMPGHTMVGGYPASLRGFPYVTTSQITIDTDNNNETKVYFGQWKDILIGMHKSIELMASNVAGTSFEYNQTWIRAIMRLDWVLQHNESIEILTDVRTS